MDPAADAPAGAADVFADANASEDDSEERPGEGSDVELGSTSQHVRDQLEELSVRHIRKGEAAYERQEWDQAVKEFTSGLKCASGTRQEAELLVKRSSALNRFAQHLLSIPARVSEYRAVYAHDPSVLAQLSLKDAQRVAKLRPSWGEACACEGRALLLLEKHADAESAFLEGLALDPGHKTLAEDLKRVQDKLAQEEQEQQQLLADVRKASVDGGSNAAAATEAAAAVAAAAGGSSAAAAAAAAGGSSGSSPVRRARSISLEGAAGAGGAAGLGPKRQRRLVTVSDADDADCILCMKLLYEPVTTPCGHTFCKACFARSMDHGNRCPMCRTVLHVGRELPVSVTLQSILSRAFPEDYSSRAAEAAAAAAAAAGGSNGSSGGNGSSARVTLPLFVMSTMVPGEKMALNIFEPRYRLMVRRVMEGNRRFGMAQTGRTGPDGLDELAIEAEILECNPLPDGRYYLELVGRRRLKLTQSWELDGYRVASAELLVDQVNNPLNPTAAGQQGGGQNPGAVTPTAAAAAGQDPSGAGADAAAGSAGDAAAGGGSNGSNGGSNGSNGGSNGCSVSAAELASEVLGVGDELLAKMRGMLASRRMAAGHIRELFDRLGDKPSPSNPEAVSWWGARLLLLLLPSNAESWMRRELLAETSTVARLQRLKDRLGVMAGAEVVGGQSCSIM